MIELYEKRSEYYDDILIPVIGHLLLAFTILFIFGGTLLFVGEFVQATGIEVIDWLCNKISLFSVLPVIALVIIMQFINMVSYKHIKHS